MGSFDHLSDNDPRVVAHEERKLRNKYSTKITEFSDSEILKEFKKRFNGTVLNDLNINGLLNTIGLVKIRKYLREEEGYYLQANKKHKNHIPL